MFVKKLDFTPFFDTSINFFIWATRFEKNFALREDIHNIRIKYLNLVIVEYPSDYEYEYFDYSNLRDEYSNTQNIFEYSLRGFEYCIRILFEYSYSNITTLPTSLSGPF